MTDPEMPETGKKELVLQGKLTIQRIAELKEELVAALEKTDKLLIKITESSDLDLSFLQLLCSAHRTAVALNKSLTLVGAFSREISRTLKTGGFERNIGCSRDCDRSCIWVRGKDE